MSAAGFRSVALVAAALLPMWSAEQPGIYRHPQGLFSAPLPPGWTAETGKAQNALLQSGKAFVIIGYVPGGGADPEQVARRISGVYSSFRDPRRLRSGTAQLGGAAGSFEVYSITDEHGAQLLLRAATAPAGDDALLVLSSSPAAEWDRWKTAFGTIEHGLRFRGAPGAATRGNYTPPPATAPPAAHGSGSGMPSASRAVPNGFRIAGRSGEAGQALTATFTGGRSAKATFRSALRIAGEYFDQPPVIGSAVVGPHDETVEGLFRASWRGTAVRGLMVASIDGGAGYVGMIFDRENQFARSLPDLSRQMQASLPAQTQGGGRQAAAPVRRYAPQRLTQTTLPDGSGSVGLPAGWTITGAYKGCFDASGPNHGIASLGCALPAITNPLPGTPANVVTGPYRDPVHALPQMIDVALMQGKLRSRQASMEIIESAPVATQQGQGQAAYIAFRLRDQQAEGRYLAMVQTAPIDDSSWFAYMSVVGCSSNHFAEMFPTLWAMWKSWSVNPAVFRERMDAALQSMRDTFAIMQGIEANRAHAAAVANLGWSQVFNGVTTIQNLPGVGEPGEAPYQINNNSLYLLQSLGLEGKGYRVVSPAELVGNGG